MNLNKALIIGRIGKEIKGIKNGCKFSVATSEVFKNNDGKDIERTEWHNVLVFGGQAAACEKFLVPGQEVCVEGKISTNTYEKEGQKHYSTSIIASNVGFGQKPARSTPNDQQDELGF